jgi:geranylgeranyl diphosphate synthase type II
LQEPIHYLLSIGGKRMRPVLALLGAELFGKDPKEALPAALCVEVFHNFTLMHDDIMDEAPLRRGQQTVHQKWNVNTAILSGDAMLIEAYDILCAYEGDVLKKLLPLFNKIALGVCLGQQMDMEFESRSDVTVEEYIEMIRLKTAVLLGGALEMGGTIAQAYNKDLEHLRLFGEKLGISFQLRDDYLDAFGDPATFGKQVGGDILADKKTYLLLACFQQANESQRALLRSLMGKDKHAEEKIRLVKQVMIETQADRAIEQASKMYYDQALLHLNNIQVNPKKKVLLASLAAQLLHRSV